MLLNAPSLAHTIRQIDFDISMGKNHASYDRYYQKGMLDIHTQENFSRLRSLYTKNINLLATEQTSIKIPKIIHQIWLGSPLPATFLAYTKTWQQHHPDWQYKLWTDADIAQLKLENQDIYDHAINYAERSDIARYEILYRFGGLYVDTDCECFKPFDILNHSYDFYAGVELPAMAPWLGAIILPNALIACTPQHPILRACIDEVRKRSTTNSHDIVIKTGPLVFTDMALKLIDDPTHCNIIFPATFFYPIDKETKGRANILSMVQPETFAIHHWAGSWILKEEAFVPGIKIKSEITGNKIRFIICDTRI